MKLETYIPYSIRNNITDPDLAWILDYLEREMGWDIEYKSTFAWFWFIIKIKNNIADWTYDFKESVIDVNHFMVSFSNYYNDNEDDRNTDKEIIFIINKYVFMNSYKSILPAIRDLYRNK